MRIGHGFDVHRFGPGDHLMIGGVALPFEQGFVAHSDGDVLLHAISDALLGACALGDIGHHFPDTDPPGKAPTAVACCDTSCRWCGMPATRWAISMPP